MKEKQALVLQADKFDESQYGPSEKKAAGALASVKAGKVGLRAVVETDDEGGR